MFSLTPEQQAAAQREGQDACCVAGPGSGKTRVLVERFAWLVRKGFDPQQILAITFTEKATRQMKERLAERFKDDEAKQRQVERASVYTIDGFCHSLLRTHALRAGLDPEFQVLDPRDARLQAIAAMSATLDRFATGHPERFLALLGAWTAGVDKMAGDLLEVYERMRAAGGVPAALAQPARMPDLNAEFGTLRKRVEELLAQSPPATTPGQKAGLARIRQWLAGQEAMSPAQWLTSFDVTRTSFRQPHPLNDGINEIKARLDELVRDLATVENEPHRKLIGEILLDFEQEFARRKREAAGLDFADLNEQACRLLASNRDIQKAVRERFRQILMDELQDTSPVQWELVRLVRGEQNLFAVGDINQSIYGFRRAEPQIFHDFRESIGRQGAIDRLTRNYRSDPGILQTVNEVVKHCQAGVEPHELVWPEETRTAKEPVVELLKLGEGDDESLALWVGWRVRQLVEDSQGSLPLASIAVLARTTKTFDLLEAAFERFSIPCVVKRGRNFFSEPEIVDLTNWLRVLDNPQNEVALVGLLRSPFFYQSDEEIYRRRVEGQLMPEEIWESRRLRAEIPIDQVLAREIDRRGFLRGLRPPQQANVSKFLQILRDLQRRQQGGLTEWIETIDGLRADGQETNALEPESPDAVEILTVHSAKGLEWPVVFVTALEKNAGGWPSPINWSPRHGIGASWRTPLKTSDRHYCESDREAKQRESEEENRLLYVAMTRAMSKLVLVWREAKQPGPWVKIVEKALTPDFPATALQRIRKGPVAVMRLEGVPDAPSEPLPVAQSAAAPERLQPLQVELQAPPSVSVTALAHFHDCPRRHLLAHVLHWPQPERPGAGDGAVGGMALGTEVHELLAGLREENTAGELALDLAESFRRSELGRRVARASRLEREFDFLVEAGGMLLQGAIDLWFEDEQGVTLVDYKSDQQWSEARQSDYSAQLRLYALALERHTGRPVKEAWLFRLRDATAIPVSLEGDLGLSLIHDYQASARAGDYPMRPADRCRWCPYRHAPCPAE